jgi:hypothetical protein
MGHRKTQNDPTCMASIVPQENFLERTLQENWNESAMELRSSDELNPGWVFRLAGDPMTFETRGHTLRSVLEGLPFLVGGRSYRREYQGAGGGFSPTPPFFFVSKLSNRPGHLNALPEART